MRKFIKLTLIITILFIFIYIEYNVVTKRNYYVEKLNKINNKIIEGTSAPRGRILDKNGVVLVDNIATKSVIFHYKEDINFLDVATKINNLYDFDIASEKELIWYYKMINNENDLLSKEEKLKIKNRKINADQKEEIINNKIKQIVLAYSDSEKKLAHVYYMMTNGALYEDKVIIEDIDDNLCDLIINENIPGVSIETTFERYYPYGDILKQIFGKIGKIPSEEKNEYLKKGYNLNDIVGLSYLEKYYDDYLKGTKATYQVNSDYSLTKLTEEVKGNDLYLSIDINVQMEVEKIIQNDIKYAKTRANTNYLTDSYVIVGDPNTGAILAIAGQRYLSNEEFVDVALGNITSSFTMGSAVKGATISVGYKYGLIDANRKILDGCVKLQNQNSKCSYESLGYIDAVTALEKSSNYYQFLIAISLCNQTYIPNMQLNATKKEFDIYRQMLASYGLGIKTGIDLPNEQTGQIGNKISGDLLLNLAIGQYDTYTPIELFTYINTISSGGNRRKPSLVSKIVDTKDNVVYENNYEIVEHVDIKDEDNKKIIEGFYRVMNYGTGRGFMDRKLSPAGKTGTSESFLDTNNDGKIDTETISLTMVGFFPYDNPKYSLVVISPHVSFNNNNNPYIYYLNARISKNVTNFLATLIP